MLGKTALKTSLPFLRYCLKYNGRNMAKIINELLCDVFLSHFATCLRFVIHIVRQTLVVSKQIIFLTFALTF